MRKLKLEELGRMSVAEFHLAKKRPVTVILDNVRSMHNVGSILRTSDAFLIEKVYLCGITPKPPHREIRKTAIGADESVDWEACEDILTLVNRLKADGYFLLALEQTDNSIQLPDYEPSYDKCAIILGHEVTGVSEEVIGLCDAAIEIPQFGTKHSLNVSVAAGIILYALTAIFPTPDS